MLLDLVNCVLAAPEPVHVQSLKVKNPTIAVLSVSAVWDAIGERPELWAFDAGDWHPFS